MRTSPIHPCACLPVARTLALILALTLFGFACADSAPPADVATAPVSSEPQTDEEKTLYALGASLGSSLAKFDLTEPELEWVTRGMNAKVLNLDLAVDEQAYQANVMAFVRERTDSASSAEAAAAASFLAEAAAAEGAVKSDSGLIMTEITAGDGAAPSATDTVVVHYHGTLRDGSVFDSSVERGEPARFPLNRVIPCWTEALQKMHVGGKSRIVCPPEIAYGSRGSGRIPGGAALVFEVELLEIAPASS